MKHRVCLGEIVEDWDKAYEYWGMIIPSFVCQRCGKEILGDAEIELDEDIQ